MECYIVKMISGGHFEITQNEYSQLMGKNGLVFIPSQGRTINTNSISEILPKRAYMTDKLEERKKQTEGVLHDGTPVIRYFGQWFLLNGDYDEQGRPKSRAWEEWYPEVARDCVPTKHEFYDKYEKLSKSERLKLLLEGTREPRQSQLEPIKYEKLSEKYKN